MPGWLIEALRGGWITGLAVLILVVETGALLALRRRLRLDARPLLFNAASGIALMVALGSALSDAPNHALVVLCLAASFAAHLGDIVTRAGRAC